MRPNDRVGDDPQAGAAWLVDVGADSAAVAASGDEAQRLRQNSPFVGILTLEEVREFKRIARDAARAA